MAICEEYRFEEEEDDDVVSPVFFRRRPESKSVISVQRRSCPWIVAEEDDDPITIVESREMTCKRHYKRFPGRNCINPNRKNGPLTVLVTESYVLNCPICFDLLQPPIYQCQNGDIVCSSCYSKLLEDEKKCPFCLMSIHNNIRRCHGLERFIDSISKISCKNAYNGCKKLLDYNNKTRHEETCPYVSCKCPYPLCCYPGLSKDVYAHFSIQHAASVIGFAYDSTFSVSVDVINQKKNHMTFLQELNDKVVFVLNYEFQEQGQGGVFYLEFVGPGSLKHKFIYQLTAETVDSSLSLKSVPEMKTEWSSSSPPKNYVTVPSGFADSNGFLSLSVCINKRISSNSDQEVGDEFVNEYNLSNGSIHMILVLTNPDVMNCSICLHPLFTPCFQYANGNIVCSICCSKVEKKCPKCFPIGYNYNRCRGLEKVTESSKVSCKNAEYGCRERLLYNEMASLHEESCGYALCFCPHQSCPFADININLYLHFGIEHAAVITRFTYDTTFSLSVDINENHMFLQEQRQNRRGAIFILNHQVQEHGRVFYLDCVCSNTLKRCFGYQLSAKSMEKTVHFKALPEMLSKWPNQSPPKNYLMVPSDFASYNDPLSLSICIRNGLDVSRWLLLGDKCS